MIGDEENLASREGAAEGGFKGGIPPRPSVPPERSGGGSFQISLFGFVYQIWQYDFKSLRRF